MTKNNKKQVYIPSIEAEQLYDMSIRGLDIKVDYVGMIPYSLELIRLRLNKKFKERKVSSRYESDAIINVKFKNKISKNKVIPSYVRGYDKLVPRLEKQLEKLIKEKSLLDENIKISCNKRAIDKMEKSFKQLEFKIDDLKKKIQQIKSDKDNPIYKVMKSDELRQYLYTQGFNFKGEKYIFYKRTSSKSKNLQALFIQKKLYDEMMNWSLMGLKFEDDKEYDIASLLAYTSLVSSSISETIRINPKNILIIDDQFSKFTTRAIEVGNDLKPVHNKEATIENNIWDGQALIDKSLLESIGYGDKGFAQLRSHFFKCASFSANIQDFMIDYAHKTGKNIDTWKLRDCFGNEILAKDVLLISTPSSLKFLKYAGKSKEEQAAAYKNWCDKVKDDENLFGIVKFDKNGKYNDRQFTSYQMINTLDCNQIDIEELSKFEVEYIKSLKNTENNNTYIEYLEKNAQVANSYQMFADMCKRNPRIAETTLFKNYRKSEISKYKKYVKGGKIRIKAGYCTVVANPVEMLFSAVDDFKTVESRTFEKPNQVYSTKYSFDKEYTVLRNPHNAMHNFYKVENIDNSLIKKYINTTDNIIVINAIDSEILCRLNGMDQDGDSLLLIEDTYFNKIIDKTLGNGNYPVILNKITSKPKPVQLTNANIAKIDADIGISQKWTGSITNLAQYFVSVLWDLKQDSNYIQNDTKNKADDIEEILSNLAILVILSNVAIDYSKKKIDVDVDSALSQIRKNPCVKKLEYNAKGKLKLHARNKPKFWESVTNSKPNKSDFYNCPMDLLSSHISKIEDAKYTHSISLLDCIRELKEEEKKQTYDHKQVADIINAVEGYSNQIKEIHANAIEDKDKVDEEKNQALIIANEKINNKINKKTIKTSTMRQLFVEVQKILDATKIVNKKKKTSKVNNKDEIDKNLDMIYRYNKMRGIATQILNVLYQKDPEKFLDLIKSGE